jgi:hypothetical protein
MRRGLKYQDSCSYSSCQHFKVQIGMAYPVAQIGFPEAALGVVSLSPNCPPLSAATSNPARVEWEWCLRTWKPCDAASDSGKNHLPPVSPRLFPSPD